jgi:3-methyladenine DNA glycosylase AlkC
MPEKLKDILITAGQVLKLAEEIHAILPEFEVEKFAAEVHDLQWANLELKQKMRQITECLHQHLPADYPQAISVLEQISSRVTGFIALSLSDFAECYGLDYWDISMNALAHFTCSCSSEFGVRPFLDKDPERAIQYFYRWADNENPSIRRLASEGCRPRLPWGMALVKFKKDPSLIMPILEKLKSDPEEFVRRSVANNLNDISKDHPALVLDLCERWKGQSPEIDRIIKHACRTMLKDGNKRALILFGFANPELLSVTGLFTDKQNVQIGEHLAFSFTLVNHSGKPQKVRLEYRIHYIKSGGKTSAKVFQISEGKFPMGEYLITKRQAFTDFTTCTHYAGEHRIEIIVDGETKAETRFLLSGE